MRRTFLEYLVCPACKGDLDLRAGALPGAEIVDGKLRCGDCSREYPIRGGIPRFVGEDSYASSFAFQWSRFRTAQVDSFTGRRESERALAATTGWKEEDYRGRLVLDAGVGAGRYAEVAARKGAEVIGIDLTRAVDAAYANLRHCEHVHLAQADIFAMPFRDGTFDLAYAVGVLHHTPDPRAAFERVAAAVRPGGSLAVYLYARYGPGHRSSDLIRRLTHRLPPRMMMALAAASIPLYYVYRLPVIGKLLHLLAPISMHPHWRWRWLDTFDWYTPEYQWKFLYPEVFRWFRASGFGDIELFDEPIRMRGVKVAA